MPPAMAATPTSAMATLAPVCASDDPPSGAGELGESSDPSGPSGVVQGFGVSEELESGVVESVEGCPGVEAVGAGVTHTSGVELGSGVGSAVGVVQGFGVSEELGSGVVESVEGCPGVEAVGA
ncbi:hypothetical protein, partial [Actinomyces massiliensis]|uniref:hypothetical protein n=1 Tax=Actinomyces massiliensis TaxID=461393 RepID=UPI0028E8AA9B